MPLQKKIVVPLILIVALLSILSITQQSCQQQNSKSLDPTVVKADSNNFVGPASCQSCHSKEYTDWQNSDHFKAMMVANDTNVLGNFNNATLNADGVNSTFFKRNGKFIINTEGEDGKNKDFEVKFTFGYYPLQQYLVEFPGGRMQVPRQSYNVVTKKWFHQYTGQKIAAHDWLHWTKQSQNWNSMCASCHSTNLQRNYDEASDSYNTTYSHLTVSCESCHGMGKQHIDYIETSAYKNGEKVKGSYLLINKNQRSSEQLSACVQCHSRRMEISSQQNPSTESLENYIPTFPTTENYFADGQFREEDYEFGSFTQSKMFHHGVKCSNCHNPHSGKTVFDGNKLCLQCHQPKYDSPKHYFHDAKSEGSKCINCHMPTRTYMGADIRRDHSMRIPRPDQSVTYKTPNACNNCHSDKDAKWAADKVVKWYGSERKYYYTDDLIPGSLLDENSFHHLHKLVNDTSITNIIRATALNYMGELLTQESIDDIKHFLKDSSALVRNQAVTSLSNFPPELWASAVVPLLNDSVRAVRISAANSLTGFSATVLDKKNEASFNSSAKELKEFLQLQSDFPTGCVMLGDYYSKLNDFKNAEKYYLRTLKIDPVANYARLNLATIYNANKQNDKAISILNDAYSVDKKNPRIAYNLALIYAEEGNKNKAINYFEIAYRLNYDSPEIYYNYGLYMQQQGDTKKAETIFNEGLNKFPNAEKLNYGASYFFMQKGQKEKAIECIRRLKILNPTNPDYSQLFQLIGD